MGNGVQCNPVLSSVWLHCLTRYIHVLTRYLHLLNIIENMGATGSCARQSSPPSGYTASPGTYVYVLNIIDYMGNGVQCNPVLSSVLLHCLTRIIHVLNITEYMGNGVLCNPVLSSVWLHCLTRYIHVLTR